MSRGAAVTIALALVSLMALVSQLEPLGWFGLWLLPVAMLGSVWCIWLARDCEGLVASTWLGLGAWIGAVTAHAAGNFTVLSGAAMVTVAQQKGQQDVVVSGSADALWWMATVLLVAVGARFWFGAELRQAVVWGVGVGMLNPVTLVLFLLLRNWLPLTA